MLQSSFPIHYSLFMHISRYGYIQIQISGKGEYFFLSDRSPISVGKESMHLYNVAVPSEIVKRQ